MVIQDKYLLPFGRNRRGNVLMRGYSFLKPECQQADANHLELLKPRHLNNCEMY